MAVNDFKGEQPDAKSPLRTVASSSSGYRQTVPSEAEEDNAHILSHDLPPSYEASFQHQAAVSDNVSTTSTPVEASRMINRSRSGRPCPSAARSSIDTEGYTSTEKMTWAEKDTTGYWDKCEHETGACCSRRGGCVFSDRDGCCFSDREACCFSDHGACCFSDHDACCFSDNDACCWADNGACCFSGTLPGQRWRPIPSLGTLFKGVC